MRWTEKERRRDIQTAELERIRGDRYRERVCVCVHGFFFDQPK